MLLIIYNIIKLLYILDFANIYTRGVTGVTGVTHAGRRYRHVGEKKFFLRKAAKITPAVTAVTSVTPCVFIFAIRQAHEVIGYIGYIGNSLCFN